MAKDLTSMDWLTGFRLPQQPIPSHSSDASNKLRDQESETSEDTWTNSDASSTNSMFGAGISMPRDAGFASKFVFEDFAADSSGPGQSQPVRFSSGSFSGLGPVRPRSKTPTESKYVFRNVSSQDAELANQSCIPFSVDVTDTSSFSTSKGKSRKRKSSSPTPAENNLSSSSNSTKSSKTSASTSSKSSKRSRVMPYEVTGPRNHSPTTQASSNQSRGKNHVNPNPGNQGSSSPKYYLSLTDKEIVSMLSIDTTLVRNWSPFNARDRPPFTFTLLIAAALSDAPNRMMRVVEIYSWIENHFVYYKSRGQEWRNSVRHALSLHKMFYQNVPPSDSGHPPALKKGNSWSFRPEYEDTICRFFFKYRRCLPFFDNSGSSESFPAPQSRPLGSNHNQSNVVVQPLSSSMHHPRASSAPLHKQALTSSTISQSPFLPQNQNTYGRAQHISDNLNTMFHDGDRLRPASTIHLPSMYYDMQERLPEMSLTSVSGFSNFYDHALLRSLLDQQRRFQQDPYGLGNWEQVPPRSSSVNDMDLHLHELPIMNMNTRSGTSSSLDSTEHGQPDASEHVQENNLEYLQSAWLDNERLARVDFQSLLPGSSAEQMDTELSPSSLLKKSTSSTSFSELSLLSHPLLFPEASEADPITSMSEHSHETTLGDTHGFQNLFSSGTPNREPSSYRSTISLNPQLNGASPREPVPKATKLPGISSIMSNYNPLLGSPSRSNSTFLTPSKLSMNSKSAGASPAPYNFDSIPTPFKSPNGGYRLFADQSSLQQILSSLPMVQGSPSSFSSKLPGTSPSQMSGPLGNHSVPNLCSQLLGSMPSKSLNPSSSPGNKALSPEKEQRLSLSPRKLLL